jgi:hypothetical protein
VSAAVGRGRDVELLGAEILDQQFAHVGLVVDDQHAQ